MSCALKACVVLWMAIVSASAITGVLHSGGAGQHLKDFAGQCLCHAVWNVSDGVDRGACGQAIVALGERVLAGRRVAYLVDENQKTVVHGRVPVVVQLAHAVPELGFILWAGSSLPGTEAAIDFMRLPEQVKLKLHEDVHGLALDKKVKPVPFSLAVGCWAPLHDCSNNERSEGGLVNIAEPNKIGVRLQPLQCRGDGLLDYLFHASSLTRGLRSATLSAVPSMLTRVRCSMLSEGVAPHHA